MSIIADERPASAKVIGTADRRFRLDVSG